MLFTPAERDAAAVRIVQELKADDRIEAVVITGSLGSGRADRWSDVDLTAVLFDGVATRDVVADWVARMYAAWPVVHHYENNFESTEVRGFLISNGLVIDLGFTSAAAFSVWGPVKVAFDRTGAASAVAASVKPWEPTPDWTGQAGYAWHDVVHAAAAARGRPWQALFYLQRIRNRTLILASERHGWDAQDFTRVDDLPADQLDALRPTLVSQLDTAALLRAIDDATGAFLAELGHGEPELATRLAVPLTAVVQAAITAHRGDDLR